MRMFAGLDVGFKRTAVCVVDEAGRIVWRGVADTHPEGRCRAGAGSLRRSAWKADQ
jgi:predicted NBD/HSP70 family sugar kinase